MFKRFWQSLSDWAEALAMDDPRGDYTFRLEDRVAKLVGPDDRVHQLQS